MDQGGGIDQEEKTDQDLQEEEEDQRQRLGKQEIEMGRYLKEIVLNVSNRGTRDINVKNQRGNLKEDASNAANWDIRNINVTNQRGKNTNHCISTSRMEDTILIKKRKTSIKEKGTDLGVPVGNFF